jgi:hypothetical protein
MAPLGSSVRVIACEEVSASVSIVRVAVTGVTGEYAATAGAESCTANRPPFATIGRPTTAFVVNPGAPVSETEVMCASAGPVFVSVNV